MTAIHVMIDFETASMNHNAAPISLGAHAFAGRLHYTDQYFHQKNSLASAEIMGLHVDKETMEWWDKQNPQIRADAFSGKQALVDMLEDFKMWCSKLSEGRLQDIHIWGNGADFDPIILKNAYETHTSYPFNFRNHRCYRTVNAIFDHLIPYPKYAERQHDALADATWQSKRLCHLISTGVITL